MPGNLADIIFRLRSMLPRGWFSDQSPNLAAILTSFATPWAWLYRLLSYVQLQTRISTATDAWLDIAAQDYLGERCQRNPNETDAAYRLRIKKSLLCGAATRRAISSRIEQLTGADATIFEPSNPCDTGGYGAVGRGSAPAPSGLGYGLAGGWGSLRMPYQFLITVKRPVASNAALLAGYGGPAGGYGAGSVAYLNLGELPGQPTDQDIQSEVRRLLPVNAVAWMRII